MFRRNDAADCHAPGCEQGAERCDAGFGPALPRTRIQRVVYNAAHPRHGVVRNCVPHCRSADCRTRRRAPCFAARQDHGRNPRGILSGPNRQRERPIESRLTEEFAVSMTSWRETPPWPRPAASPIGGLQAAFDPGLAEAGHNRLIADLLRLPHDRSAPLFRCYGFAFARRTRAERGRILAAAIARDAERLWRLSYWYAINSGPRCRAKRSEPSRHCGCQRRRVDPRTMFSRLDSPSDASGPAALGNSRPVTGPARS